MCAFLPASTTNWVRQLQQFQHTPVKCLESDFDMLEMMSGTDGAGFAASLNRTAWVMSWENVLAPTQWMATRVGLTPTREGVEQAQRCCASMPSLRDSIVQMEERVLELLALAASVGPVYILSDEPTAFVEATCEAFFPRLFAALQTCGGRVKVVGLPAAAMALAQKAAWKVDAFQSICFESTSVELLLQPETGNFRLITVSADEMDVLASSAVKDIAPFAVVKSVQMPVAQNGATSSLEGFQAQLQGLITAVQEELEMDKL